MLNTVDIFYTKQQNVSGFFLQNLFHVERVDNDRKKHYFDAIIHSHVGLYSSVISKRRIYKMQEKSLGKFGVTFRTVHIVAGKTLYIVNF
jgi:hypothetical protein